MSKYYVEYGALQANATRLIECDTSALPPKKITEAFAREIADALNSREPVAPHPDPLTPEEELADTIARQKEVM